MSPMRLTITHGERASVDPEREPEDRSQVVLELARRGAVDRPVPRVVDARRELVGEQPPLDLEELDGEDADVVERVEKGGADLLCFALRRIARRGARDAQDALAVQVLADGPEARVAFPRAHADDRQLPVERDELLRELVVADRRGRIESTLSLAVVAEPSRLDERRHARLFE